MEEKNNERVIDIKPLSKGKRMLVYLGDFFLSFILSFVLFNLAIFPLAKIIVNTLGKIEEVEKYENSANDVLIKNKLTYTDKSKTNSFLNNVNYTFKVFLSYYAFDEETVDTYNPQFGHKKENEVIYHYLVEMRNEQKAYMDAFKKENGDGFFTIGDTPESIHLNSEYKITLGTELLEVTDEEKYSDSMINFRDHVFARLFYIYVYNDITKNDLTYDGVSYNDCLKKVDSINYYLRWVVSISCVITVFISTAIFFIIIPFIQKDRKTIAFMMMRIYRVNKRNFAITTRLEALVQWLYQFLLHMAYAIFLPMITINVAYCFNLPIVMHFFFLSSVFMLASMFCVVFDQYNRSGSDILTQSVLIPSDELDNLYKIEE